MKARLFHFRSKGGQISQSDYILQQFMTKMHSRYYVLYLTERSLSEFFLSQRCIWRSVSGVIHEPQCVVSDVQATLTTIVVVAVATNVRLWGL